MAILSPWADKAVKEIRLPLRHEDIIRQQANDKNLDPSLIAGVIYVESRFRDQPRSRRQGPDADHRGAPPTTSPTSPGTAFVQGDLAEPQINIAYRSWYMRCSSTTTATPCSRSPPTTPARGRSTSGGRARPNAASASAWPTTSIPGDARLRREGAGGPARVPPRVRARAGPLVGGQTPLGWGSDPLLGQLSLAFSTTPLPPLATSPSGSSGSPAALRSFCAIPRSPRARSRARTRWPTAGLPAARPPAALLDHEVLAGLRVRPREDGDDLLVVLRREAVRLQVLARLDVRLALGDLRGGDPRRGNIFERSAPVSFSTARA